MFGPWLDAASAAEPQAQADQLVDLIEIELSTINARVEEAWRERVDGEIAATVDLELRADRLRLAAHVQAPDPTKPATVVVALGTILAIDDLTLFSLSSADVLIPDRPALAVGEPGEPFAPPEPLALAGAGLDRDGRFFEYDRAFAPELDHAQLTHAMPLNPWRLLQASLLSELSIAWVLLHERAHWALGHLDLIKAAGLNELSLAETEETTIDGRFLEAAGESPIRLESGVHRALEVQADTQAFLLLCHYAMKLGGARDRYEAETEAFSVPDDPRVLRTLSFGATLRLCIMAVGLTCVAFDEARGGKGAPISKTHPRPASRLMSMLINAPLISPMTKRDDKGHWILAEEDRVDSNGEDNEAFRELAQAAIGMALMDLLIITTAVGADFIPLELDPDASNGWGPSEWLTDLTKFWVVDGEDEGPPTSPPGIEIDSLRAIDAKLLSYLEGFQTERFGRVLSVDIGDIWPDRPARHS